MALLEKEGMRVHHHILLDLKQLHSICYECYHYAYSKYERLMFGIPILEVLSLILSVNKYSCLIDVEMHN